MPQLSDALKERVDEASKELDEARKALQAAQQREQDALKAFTTYQSAWEFERRREGKSPVQESLQGISATAPIVAEDGNGDEENKTRIVRTFFLMRGAQGAKAKELWRHLSSTGVTVNKNYSYGALARLSKRGELSSSKGVYYATEKMKEVATRQN